MIPSYIAVIGIILIIHGLYEVCDFFHHSWKYEPIRYEYEQGVRRPRPR